MASLMELQKNFGFKYTLWSYLDMWAFRWFGIYLDDYIKPPKDKHGVSHYMASEDKDL